MSLELDPEHRRLYRLYVDQKKDSAQKALAQALQIVKARSLKDDWEWDVATAAPGEIGDTDERYKLLDDDDWLQYADRELRKL